MATEMKNTKIISPMATSSGAYVLHKMLEDRISCYTVRGYPPKLTFMPFFLPLFIKTYDADLIHTVPDYGLFFYKPRKPMVTTIHHYMCDGKMDPYSSFLQRIHYRTDLKWYIKRSLVLSDVITAVSNYTARHVRKNIKISQTIHVIKNGIDESFFRPFHSRPPSKKLKVLFSGNLTKRKGAQWLPLIAKKLNSGIKINCTGGFRKEIHNYFSSQINWLGNIEHFDMPSIYGQHDILLAPSTREGFGLAIAEAMACGLPVVASDCSAIPELIDDSRGGFLCPVGDVECFAEKINLLADSPQTRLEMGQYNRLKIEKYFTVKRMVNEYKKLFETILVS